MNRALTPASIAVLENDIANLEPFYKEAAVKYFGSTQAVILALSTSFAQQVSYEDMAAFVYNIWASC